ncbi:hypothetical protein DUNSADRAFT_4312 [Dunaliella salina]|uniref:Uncharacterized protein n=1 Tax=Dunaliella salina TaxID=3046 RepID=A0ABQ7H7L9_DUNSA|nr:hypothetical protein DUNSADRAFT_4312 [Dunaliella salina]|eukprot:KAF5842853.1 hypothetical protein DUNSADRAFT_4312 [Dunaliella salina]
MSMSDISQQYDQKHGMAEPNAKAMALEHQQQHQTPATPSQGNSTNFMYQSIDLDAEEISWVMTPAPDLRSKSTGESSNSASCSQRRLGHLATPTSRASMAYSPSTSALSSHTCVVSTGSTAAVSNSLDWVTSGAAKPLPAIPTSTSLLPDHRQQHQHPHHHHHHHHHHQQQQQQQQQQQHGEWQAASPSTPGCSHGASTPDSGGGDSADAAAGIGNSRAAAAPRQKAGAAAWAAGLFADAQGCVSLRGKEASAASMAGSALEGGACKGGALCDVEVGRHRQARKEKLEQLQGHIGNATPASGSVPADGAVVSATPRETDQSGVHCLASHTQAICDQGKQDRALHPPATAVSRAGVPAGLMEARQLACGQGPSQMAALTPVQQQCGHSGSAQEGHESSWASSSTQPSRHLESTWESSPSPKQQQQDQQHYQQQQHHQQGRSPLSRAPSQADWWACSSDRFQFQHTNPLAHEPPSPDWAFGGEAAAAEAAPAWGGREAAAAGEAASAWGAWGASPGEAHSHEVGAESRALCGMSTTPHLVTHTSQSGGATPGVSASGLTTLSWNVLFGDDGLASGQATPAAATAAKVAGHAIDGGINQAEGDQQQGAMLAAASPVLALCAPAAPEPVEGPATGADRAGAHPAGAAAAAAVAGTEGLPVPSQATPVTTHSTLLCSAGGVAHMGCSHFAPLPMQDLGTCTPLHPHQRHHQLQQQECPAADGVGGASPSLSLCCSSAHQPSQGSAASHALTPSFAIKYLVEDSEEEGTDDLASSNTNAPTNTAAQLPTPTHPHPHVPPVTNSFEEGAVRSMDSERFEGARHEGEESSKEAEHGGGDEEGRVCREAQEGQSVEQPPPNGPAFGSSPSPKHVQTARYVGSRLGEAMLWGGSDAQGGAEVEGGAQTGATTAAAAADDPAMTVTAASANILTPNTNAAAVVADGPGMTTTAVPDNIAMPTASAAAAAAAHSPDIMMINAAANVAMPDASAATATDGPGITLPAASANVAKPSANTAAPAAAAATAGTAVPEEVQGSSPSHAPPPADAAHLHLPNTTTPPTAPAQAVRPGRHEAPRTSKATPSFPALLPAKPSSSTSLADAAALCALGARVAHLVRTNGVLEEQVAAMHLQLAAAEEEQQWQASQLAEAEAVRGAALLQAGRAVRARSSLQQQLHASQLQRAEGQAALRGVRRELAAAVAARGAADAAAAAARRRVAELEEALQREPECADAAAAAVGADGAAALWKQRVSEAEAQGRAAGLREGEEERRRLAVQVESLVAELKSMRQLSAAAQESMRMQLAAKEGSIKALQGMLTDLQATASFGSPLPPRKPSPCSLQSSPSPSPSTRTQTTHLLELRVCVGRMQRAACMLAEEIGCDQLNPPPVDGSDSWTCGALDGLHKQCSHVAAVLHSCVAELTPGRLSELDRKEEEGDHIPASLLAAALAEAQGAADSHENRQVSVKEGQQELSPGSLISGATSEALQELRARCGEYERTVARLQERLGEALCDAEAAKQQQLQQQQQLVVVEGSSRQQQHQQLVVVEGAGGKRQEEQKQGLVVVEGPVEQQVQQQQLTRPHYFSGVDGADTHGTPNSQGLRKSLEALLSQLAGEEMPQLSQMSRLAGEEMPQLSRSSHLAGEEMPQLSQMSRLAREEMPQLSQMSLLAGEEMPQLSQMSQMSQVSQLAGGEASAADPAQHDAACHSNMPRRASDQSCSTTERGQRGAAARCCSPMHDSVQQRAQSRRVAGCGSVVLSGGHMGVTALTGSAVPAAQPGFAARRGYLSLAEAIQLVEATCARKQAAEVLLLEAEQRMGVLQHIMAAEKGARTTAEECMQQLQRALSAEKEGRTAAHARVQQLQRALSAEKEGCAAAQVRVQRLQEADAEAKRAAESKIAQLQQLQEAGAEVKKAAEAKIAQLTTMVDNMTAELAHVQQLQEADAEAKKAAEAKIAQLQQLQEADAEAKEAARAKVAELTAAVESKMAELAAAQAHMQQLQEADAEAKKAAEATIAELTAVMESKTAELERHAAAADKEEGLEGEGVGGNSELRVREGRGAFAEGVSSKLQEHITASSELREDVLRARVDELAEALEAKTRELECVVRARAAASVLPAAVPGEGCCERAAASIPPASVLGKGCCEGFPAGMTAACGRQHSMQGSHQAEVSQSGVAPASCGARIEGAHRHRRRVPSLSQLAKSVHLPKGVLSRLLLGGQPRGPLEHAPGVFGEGACTPPRSNWVSGWDTRGENAVEGGGGRRVGVCGRSAVAAGGAPARDGGGRCAA